MAIIKSTNKNFPSGTVDKSLPANAGDTGWISGLGGFHTPMCYIYWAPMLQLLKPMHLEPLLYKRNHRNEKPTYCDEE